MSEIAQPRSRARAVRLPEQTSVPRTLTLEQIAAIVASQRRLRDRFLFALLASTGMRIGQALALRHEDIVPWEQRIVIAGRPDDTDNIAFANFLTKGERDTVEFHMKIR